MPSPRKTPLTVTPQVYSPTEVSILLGVSRQSIYKHIAEGKLAAIKLGSRIVVRRETVVALLGREPVTAVADGRAA